MAVTAVLPSQVLADGASDGDLLTVQADGSVAFEAPAGGGGIGGSTGARDNAVLRADGTDGDTLQDSNWDIPDIYTASPNATVNHLSMQATGNTTNVSVSIVPKGTGSFSLAVPDGTTTGGNVRGSQAVDLQLLRHVNTAVASGAYAVAAGGENTASGYGSIAYGIRNLVTSQYGLGLGLNNTVSGYAAVAIGRGLVADRNGVTAFGADAFGLTRLQHIACCMRGTTTDGTTQVELTIPSQSSRLSLVAGTVMTINIKIVGSRDDGSAVAIYERQYAAKRVGSASSEIQAPVTIGTDVAAGTSMTLDVDDTNDAIRLRVVGVTSQTWKWRAFVLGGEFAY
jgi:hypothetical protein